MLLLECLPPERISREARLHFDELKRKFPWAKFEMPGSGFEEGFVGPPVPSEVDKLHERSAVASGHAQVCG